MRSAFFSSFVEAEDRGRLPGGFQFADPIPKQRDAAADAAELPKARGDHGVGDPAAGLAKAGHAAFLRETRHLLHQRALPLELKIQQDLEGSKDG